MTVEFDSSSAKVFSKGWIEAKVIRCGCGDPLKHALKQRPCPTPREIEDLGVIASSENNDD